MNRKIIIVFFFIFAAPAYALAPDVTLISPTDSQSFTTTNNVTFNCSAASDNCIWNISLYHNVSGSFELNQTKVYGEFINDSSTLFLCHFNDDYTCTDGEQGTNSSTSFDSGKFKKGVLVDGSDTLIYSAVNNFDREQGTIELWVKPTFNLGALGDDAIFLTVGENDENMFTFYLNEWDERIEFIIYDSGGTDRYVVKSISGWQADVWHHLVGIWDLDSGVSGNHRLELYVDGSKSGNQYWGFTTSNIVLDTDPPTIFVGTYWDSSWWAQANSVIDELRISNVVRTDSEISESYKKGNASYSNVSANWTMSVPEGDFIWNCLAYDNESQSNWSASNSSFTVNLNPPAINSIVISPNSPAGLDPSTTINVTANVTDVSGVDTVILQWNNVSGVWNNDTMDKSGDIYNASFDTETNGTYYYRIWANDSSGSINISSTTAIDVAFDWGWTSSPTSFGVKSGVLGEQINIGNLNITSESDYNLTFNLSSSKDWIKFDSSTGSASYEVNAGESHIIVVNASLPTIEAEFSVTMNISVANASATPPSKTVNATVIVHPAGPYLYVTIDTYSFVVTQGDANVSLLAGVTNQGNETASNVSLGWILPSGWSNTSDPLNVSKLFLFTYGPKKSLKNSLNVSISNSAPTGYQTLYAVATCAENKTGSRSVSVYVNAKSPPTTVGGDGPSIKVIKLPLPTEYGPTPAQRKEILNVKEETFELVRGENSSFEVSVTNPFENATIENLDLEVSGSFAKYLTVKDLGRTGAGGEIKIELASEPSEEGLKYNETQTYEIAAAVPTYIDKGTYPVNLTITGNVSYRDYPAVVSEATGRVLEYKNITYEMADSRTVDLDVHIISRDEGNASVEESVTDIGYMQNAGFSTRRVDRLLEAARMAMAERDYEAAKAISEDISRIKEAAFSVRDAIYELKNMIRDAEEVRGLRVPETKNLLSLAVAAFEREDYETALQRVGDAELIYSSETRGEVNYAKMVLDNLAAVIVGIGAFVVVAIVSLNRANAAITVRRLEGLDVQEVNVMGLMKEAQENHYAKKTLSRTAYKETMDEFTKRLTEIRSKRARLKAKRAAMVRTSEELESLKRESQNLEELIRDSQDRYYNRRTMSQMEYNEGIEHYMAMLTEVEEAIAVLEAKVSK